MSVCMLEPELDTIAETELGDWPAEALRMMSRLTEAFPPLMERRTLPRKCYRVEAKLSLMHAEHNDCSYELYTRDVNPWSLGFITPHALPAYEHAVIELHDRNGRKLRLKCLIRRCKMFAAGWNQGVIDFETERREFAF